MEEKLCLQVMGQVFWHGIRSCPDLSLFKISLMFKITQLSSLQTPKDYPWLILSKVRPFPLSASPKAHVGMEFAMSNSTLGPTKQKDPKREEGNTELFKLKMTLLLLRPKLLAIPSLATNPSKTLRLLLLNPMSWSCKKCTFINSPSQKPTCRICLSPPSPPSSPSSASAPKWSCKACTFSNPYRNSNCEMCNTRAPVSSLSCLDDLKDTGLDEDLDSSVGSVFLPLRPCKRKMMNPDEENGDCVEVGKFRGVKASNEKVNVKSEFVCYATLAIKNVHLGLTSGFDELFNGAKCAVLDDDGCFELGKTEVVETSSKAVMVNESPASGSELKILSYNVWFREDLEMYRRMKALGEIIQLHSPDVICFQEVTPNIFDIFQQSSWWKEYRCSLSKESAYSKPYFCMQLSKLPVKSFTRTPFRNSIMGRELCVVEVEVQGNKPLVVATSHLESPCPAPPKWDQMYSKERVDQANTAVDILKKNPNVIFGGDMNWDDKLDGQFPLLDGWVDAWVTLRPGENGWTYDTKTNQMLSGNRTLQKRLDRFVCNLRDFRINRIDMIGLEAIPGLSYFKEKKVNKDVKKLELPVFPSDHYGLLLTIFHR